MRLEVRALPPERTRAPSPGPCGTCALRRATRVSSLGNDPTRVPSSRGLGHHPLKVETRVRTPLGLRELPGGSPRGLTDAGMRRFWGAVRADVAEGLPRWRIAPPVRGPLTVCCTPGNGDVNVAQDGDLEMVRTPAA